MKKLSFRGKRVIILDLDGTIVRLSVDWMSLKNVLVQQYSKIYGDDCNFESISACLSKIVEKNDKEVLENFFEIIRQFELKNIKKTQVIDETVYFINNKDLFGIKEGTKLAILSLNTRKTIIESLKLAYINDKINFIVGREDVRKWKPNPEGLYKIMSHYNLKKEEMIYFGDLEKDILTGKNAGVESYLISELISLIKKKKKSRNK